MALSSRIQPDTLSAAYALAIIGILDDLGFDAAQSWDVLGLSGSELRDPRMRVHQDLIIDLLASASQALDNPVIGLEVGEQFRVETFSETGSVLSLSGSLREAAGLNGRYQALVMSSGTSGLVEVDGQAFLQWSPRSDDVERQRHITELVMGGYATTIRWLAWSIGEAPTSVSFRHAATQSGATHPAYKRVFGMEPQFGREFNRVGLSPTGVDAPLPTAAPERLTVVRETLDKLLFGDVETLDAVRNAVLSQLGEVSLDLETVAREMGLPGSELSNKLRRSGTSFRNLLDETRRKRFGELADEGMTLAQIALELGYNDQSALTRACRRWHGLPPSAYLEKRQAPSKRKAG